jgi:uncharacterized OB-fold protein
VSAKKPEVPAVEGWFTVDPEQPQLLGSRCGACGSFFFPRELSSCRNPGCAGGTLEQVPLSRRGKLWSFTSAGYQPPPPFVPAREPFEPFAIAVVELEVERLAVLGMVPAPTSCADLRVGMTMELVLDLLYEDETRRYLTWKWKPVVEGRA